MIPEADKFAQSFIEKKIDSILYNESEEQKDCKYDILYSTALYPENGKNAQDLMKTAQNTLKEKAEAVL